MGEYELGDNAFFVVLVGCAAVVLSVFAVVCGPNKYVDCREVCAPAAVILQDGEHGRCECAETRTKKESATDGD